MTISLPPPKTVSTSASVAPRAIDVFLRYLKAEGVSVVFGIPGGLLHPFFEVIESDPDIELVVSKHEEGAAFMADGYARVSAKALGVRGTSGPGATNMITGVACAFADGIPMLVRDGPGARATRSARAPRRRRRARTWTSSRCSGR